jgi:RHS repeat-associated protein
MGNVGHKKRVPDLPGYKARFYSPALGRFLQTDPVGYTDG